MSSRTSSATKVMTSRRPDKFAQKLLDDLRIRKEKLGFSSTAAGRRKLQTTTAAETYQSSRRSLHAEQTTKNKINEKCMASMDAMQALGRRHSKAAHPAGGSPQDIVPFERSSNSVDVSMALALALSNSGKLQNVQLFSNIAVGNERIMHRGSLYLGERNSQLRMKHQMNQDTFLTSLQAGDVSMGIEQLNNILQAHSGGSKLTRESIEIGRELLRGVMDLEESLKMLIIVQDASDYMVGSQTKQVRLLKGGQEEDEASHKRMTRRSSSSYDGYSRHSQKLLANQEQRTLPSSQSRGSVITRSAKESSLHASKQSTTHRRSMSYSSLSTPESPQTGNAGKHAQSNELMMFSDSNRNLATSENFRPKNMNPNLQVEKVRMPSVIAKLMGLEELPVIKPEINREEEEEMDRNLKEDAEKVKLLHRNFRRDAEKKVLHEDSIDEIKLINGKRKTYLPQTHDIENSTRKHLQKIHAEMDKKVEGANKNDIVGGSTSMKHMIQLKDKTNVHEQMRRTKEERVPQNSNLLVSENDQQKTVKRSQCQDGKVHNKDALKEQKEDRKLPALASNQINVHRVNPNCAIQGAAKETELHAKVKLKSNRIRSSGQKVKNEEKSAYKVVVSKSVEQTRERTKSSQVKNPRTDCTHLRSERKTGCRSLADEQLVTKSHTENKTLPLVPLMPKVKRVDSPSTDEMSIVNMTAGRDESDMSKDDESQDSTNNRAGQDMNQQASSHEQEYAWVERNSQGKEITSHNTSSAQHVGVTLPPNAPPPDDRWKIEVKEKALDAEANSSNATYQRETDEKPEGLLNSTSKAETFISKEKHPEDQISDKQLEKYSINSEVPRQKKRGLLVKNLSMFIRQLSHSQQFLNTAKAMSEFEIPTDLVQTIERAFPKDASTLVLDSGLELMRRKCEREEVTCSMMRSNAHLKVRSSDELIKELNDDIESLNFPSKLGVACPDAAEFLYMMLERDIHNRNPDWNCMWDFGWNSTSFAVMEKDEIAGDAANQILDGLICEMARELMLHQAVLQ